MCGLRVEYVPKVRGLTVKVDAAIDWPLGVQQFCTGLRARQ